MQIYVVGKKRNGHALKHIQQVILFVSSFLWFFDLPRNDPLLIHSFKPSILLHHLISIKKKEEEEEKQQEEEEKRQKERPSQKLVPSSKMKCCGCDQMRC